MTYEVPVGGTFPNQASNLGHPPGSMDSQPLDHQGSPLVSFPFSPDSLGPGSSWQNEDTDFSGSIEGLNALKSEGRKPRSFEPGIVWGQSFLPCGDTSIGGERCFSGSSESGHCPRRPGTWLSTEDSERLSDTSTFISPCVGVRRWRLPRPWGRQLFPKSFLEILFGDQL